MADEPLPESWAAEGRAMRRALAADFAASLGAKTRVIVTLDSRFTPDDGPWTTVRMGAGSYTERLCEIARQADYTLLVAPETTGVLERLTSAVEGAGARTLGSSPKAVALTGEKADLGRWFEQRGIPTPRTRIVEPSKGLPADWTYPAVLKPIDGAGSMDTYRIDGPTQQPEGVGGLPASLLQPLETGEAMSAVFLVSPERGARLIVTGKQRIVVRDGRFAYQGGVLPVSCPGALPVLKRAVESVEGLRGFVGLDFLWDADRGEASVLEINPRPTTSCVGLCQVLSPGLLADAWLSGFMNPARWDDKINRIRQEVDASPMVRFGADGRIMPADEKDSEEST